MGSHTSAQGRRAINANSFASDVVWRGYEYWSSKITDAGLPGRSDIEPTEIPSLLPHIILMDVRYEPRDYRYRLIGTLVTKHLSRDWTGTWMSDIEFQKAPSQIWTNCDTAVDTRTAIISNTPYVGPYQEFMKAEDVILPLIDEQGQVNMLLVFVDYLTKHLSKP